MRSKSMRSILHGRCGTDAVRATMKRGYRYRQLDIGTALGTDDLQAVEGVLNHLIREGRVAREWAAHGEWYYRKAYRRAR